MATALLDRVFGPRVPTAELSTRPARYLSPGVVLLCARLLLIGSIFLPYWHMTLEAPQYPNNLRIEAYVNHLRGDVAEIDALNHYIGMRPLHEAAQLERLASVWAILGMALLIELAALIHNRWAALLVLPVVLYPAIFLADLNYWLTAFGNNLDPEAPLSSSVKPFTPPVLGVGMVGQFKTVASAGAGLWAAGGAGLLAMVGLVFHRRAYKPLVEAQRAAAA